MQHEPMLIVMLTHNDKTVMNAAEIFETCKNSAAQYWGMKEEPLPPEQMKALYNVFNDTSAGWEDSVIESLYNDLKKLRGE